MNKLQLFTQEWLSQELVTSPLYGTIEKILIGPNQRVSEWGPLFIIKNFNSTFQQITVGISGILSKFNINENEVISPCTGMILI
jgi:hypothetical protein